MAAAKDGSLQLGFGLGKYTNRNVMDGYAGMSRGVEQMTVRASRRLSPDPETTIIGPVRYEVRRALCSPSLRPRAERRPADVLRMALRAIVPPSPRTGPTRRGYRSAPSSSATTRSALASGWVEIDGERTEITPTPGCRPATIRGASATTWDCRPRTSNRLDPLAGLSFRMIWSPVAMERPDGSRYGLFLHYQIFCGPGFVHKHVVMGGVEHPDGRSEPFVDIEPDLSFDPVTRRLRADGSTPRRPTDRPAPSGSRSSPTPASTWARASTSGSTATTTANGGGISSSRASASPTAPSRPRPAGCTRSATPSSMSPTPPAAARGGGIASPSSPGATSRSGSRPTTPSCDQKFSSLELLIVPVTPSAGSGV